MIDDVQKELLSSISKAHDVLRRELAKLRAGRAHPSLLEGVRVDYYGTMTPLAQMAHIKASNPQVLIAWAAGTPAGTLLHGAYDAGLDVPTLTSPAGKLQVETFTETPT